ncbi:hypothetical protein EI94DRAFT_1731647, partial [Lactarius quietus]
MAAQRASRSPDHHSHDDLDGYWNGCFAGHWLYCSCHQSPSRLAGPQMTWPYYRLLTSEAVSAGLFVASSALSSLAAKIENPPPASIVQTASAACKMLSGTSFPLRSFLGAFHSALSLPFALIFLTFSVSSLSIEGLRLRLDLLVMIHGAIELPSWLSGGKSDRLSSGDVPRLGALSSTASTFRQHSLIPSEI